MSIDDRYFVDFRDARRVGVPDEDVIEVGDMNVDKKEASKEDIWRKWGLAVAPPNPKDRGDLSKRSF